MRNTKANHYMQILEGNNGNNRNRNHNVCIITGSGGRERDGAESPSITATCIFVEQTFVSMM